MPCRKASASHHAPVIVFRGCDCEQLPLGTRTAPNLTEIHNLTSGRTPASGRISASNHFQPRLYNCKTPHCTASPSRWRETKTPTERADRQLSNGAFLSQWHRSLPYIPAAERSTPHSSHGNHCVGFRKRLQQWRTTNTPACVPLFSNAFPATTRHGNPSRLRTAPPSANYELRTNHG